MKNILFLVLFIASSLFGLQREEIVPIMTSKINKATEILRNKNNLSIEEKAKKIFSMLDEVFDYALMARLSLGKTNWKALNKSQKKEFIRRFKEHLKRSFMDKLVLYKDEKTEILELKKYKKNRLWLVTQLIGNKNKYKIVYKFYKSKKSGWMVYDLNIAGVSLIQTYRVQFSDALKSGTFEDLLKKLK